MKLAVGIGVGLALATLLAIPQGLPWHMIGLGVPGYLVVLALAAAAITGGWHERRSLVLITGFGLLAAAVFQLLELVIGGQNTLGGDLSTVSLLLGGAIGLVAIGSPRTAPQTVPQT
jgi:hypothetical protein